MATIPRRGGGAPVVVGVPKAEAPAPASVEGVTVGNTFIPKRGSGGKVRVGPVKGHEAFQGASLGKLVPFGDTSGAPHGIRTIALPNAQLSEVGDLDLDALLAKHPLPPTPMGEEFILKGWQREDICTLAQWTRVGAFLPVGSGKTVIATFVALAWDDEIRIVTLKPILVKQWVRWLNSIPGTGGAVGYGRDGKKRLGPKKRAEQDLTTARWWVMSSAIFRKDFDKLQKLARGKKLTLIVDEAQDIKNTQTDYWKKCNLISLGQKLLMATGTELNSPDDGYGYIKIKTPSIYRSYTQFKNVHVEEEDFFGTVKKWRNLELLNRNLYFQAVQRTKEDVHSHLPKANYIPLFYELDPKHMRLYDELTTQQIIEMEAGGKIDGTTAQNLYLYSQQLILNWRDFGGGANVRPSGLDVLDTLIETSGFDQRNTQGEWIGPNKFIVWTWYRQSTKLVVEYLESLYPGRVVAAFSEVNSQKNFDRFEEDPNCAWLVAQPMSAGAGLNPQYICYNSLFLEFPTRTILFRQSSGRVDREGQRFNANIWIAVAEGTVQETMYKNLLNNDELVHNVTKAGRDLRAIIHGG